MVIFLTTYGHFPYSLCSVSSLFIQFSLLFMIIFRTIYPYFPIEATAPLYRISSNTKKQLKQLSCPILIAHSVEDLVIRPRAAQLLFDNVSSKQKELLWSIGEHNFVALPNLEQQKVTEKIAQFCKEPMLYFANLA